MGSHKRFIRTGLFNIFEPYLFSLGRSHQQGFVGSRNLIFSMPPRVD